MALVYTSNLSFKMKKKTQNLQKTGREENAMDDYLDELLASNEEELCFFEIEEQPDSDDAMEL